MTSGSSIQAASRSLPETSALLPSDKKACTPSPSSRARSSSAIPTPPDCEATARPPGGGTAGEKVAFSRTCGAMRPRQFGPRTRTVWRRAASSIDCVSETPSGPRASRPAEITIAALVPRAPRSSISFGTVGAGVQITARSGTPGRSSTDAKAVRPAMRAWRRLTGQIGPSKPPASRLLMTVAPTLPGRSEAPITATASGSSSEGGRAR